MPTTRKRRRNSKKRLNSNAKSKVQMESDVLPARRGSLVAQVGLRFDEPGHSLRCHLPLTWTLIFASIFQVFLAVGITWYVSNDNVTHSLELMSSTIMEALEEETSDIIQGFHDEVRLTARDLAVDFAEAEPSDPLYPEHLVPTRLYERMRVKLGLADVLNLYFSNETGAFYMLGRDVTDYSFNWYTTVGNGDQNRSQFRVPSVPGSLYPNQVPVGYKTYDPRVRPWYSAAADNGHAWSPIYPFASTGELGVTFAVTVVGNAVGVPVPPAGSGSGQITQRPGLRVIVGADITLSGLSNLLGRRTLLKSGQAFLVSSESADGNLLIAGKAELSTIGADGVRQPVRAINSNSSLIRGAFQAVRERSSFLFDRDKSRNSTASGVPAAASLTADFYSATSEGTTFSAFIDDERFIIRARLLSEDVNDGNDEWSDSLPWILVVVVPSTEFFGAIDQNNQASAVILTFTLILAVIVAVGLGLMFARPLKRLKIALKRMAALDFSSLIFLDNDTTAPQAAQSSPLGVAGGVGMLAGSVSSHQSQIEIARSLSSRRCNMARGSEQRGADARALEGGFGGEAHRSLHAETFTSFFSEIRALKIEFAHLQAALLSFARFVPPEVVQRIVRGSPGSDSLYVESRVCTILFADIISFTSLSETLSPSSLMVFLEHYYTAMTGEIEQTGGTIGDFIGDGLFVFWNAPEQCHQHATMAVHAGLAMLARLKRVNESCRRDIGPDFPEVGIRIGINTGRVLAGNIGSMTRMKFGLVGDHVNLASRLEGVNKHFGTRLLISESTYERMVEEHDLQQHQVEASSHLQSSSGELSSNSLAGSGSISNNNSSHSRRPSVEEEASLGVLPQVSSKSLRLRDWRVQRDLGSSALPVTRRLDVVTVKGRNLPTAIHEVVCFANDTQASGLRRLCTRYTDALNLYFAHKPAAAVTLLKRRILPEWPEDQPSAVLLARCKEAKLHPKKWTNVTKLEHK